MATAKDNYQPINCGFHDYLEHFATLRQKVKFVYASGNEKKILNDALIVDLSGGRDGEFAHIQTDSGKYKIRMDYIVSLNDIAANPNEGGNFC